MTVYRARWVLPIASAPVENGAVGVGDDGRITYAGPAASAPQGAVQDLGDSVLLPGLVNVHTHLELTAMRGLLEGLPFFQWILTLTRARREVLSEADLLDATRLGIIEGLSAGISTFADTCQSGVTLEAMREMGVRGIMYQEVFGPDPAMRNDSLRELEAQLAGHRQRVTDLVQVGVSPHAPYSVSAPLFAAVGELARREGLPAAIHAAESDDEDRFVRDGDGPWANSHRKRGIEVQAHGCSPVELLRRSGVLRAAPLLIHCVKTSESDVRTIAETGCAVAHCPVSNTTLGHGIAPLTEFLDAKIRVGLGSDSMASNTRMNLFDEVRAALHGQQHRNGRTLSAAHLLELATLGGARSLGLGDRIGSLEVGKDADLAAFPLHAPGHDPVNSLLTAGDARATLVTVKGSELVRDGRVLADDAQLHERVANAAGRLTRWRASQP